MWTDGIEWFIRFLMVTAIVAVPLVFILSIVGLWCLLT